MLSNPSRAISLAQGKDLILDAKAANMRDRVIRDEIHRDILVPAHMLDLLIQENSSDCATFSNCNLPLCFPGATHNRFSHSLGAYHLARVLCEHLSEVQPGVISDDDAELVSIAALLHDIGHPPFSHLLETDKVSEFSQSRRLGENDARIQRHRNWNCYSRGSR